MSKRNRPSPEPRSARPPVVRRPAAEPPRQRSSPEETLSALFDAERAARRLHRELVRAERGPVLGAIATAVAAALRERDEQEASVRLVCMAQVLGQCTGDTSVDLLIDILSSESAEARQVAGEALSELAFDRFKEVALGIERALGRLAPSSPARSEMPFLLMEVPEPGVSKLLEKMLKQQDAEAVAAAIEACAELGDPSLLGALEALREDKRRVELEDDEGETEQVELGQLAAEACDMIQGNG